MIYDPSSAQFKNLTLDVLCKDGRHFINRNAPSQPFGKANEVVSFWSDDRLILIPMNEIAQVDMIFKQPTP